MLLAAHLLCLECVGPPEGSEGASLGRWSRATAGKASGPGGWEQKGVQVSKQERDTQVPPCSLTLMASPILISTPCPGLDSSPRRRAYSTNQIPNPKPYPRAITASDPTVPARRYPLRKAKLQDLSNQPTSDVATAAAASATRGQISVQVPTCGKLGMSQGGCGEGPWFSHKDRVYAWCPL